MACRCVAALKGVAARRRGGLLPCTHRGESGNNDLDCVSRLLRKALYLRGKSSVAQTGFVSRYSGDLNLRSEKPPRRDAKHCCDLFNHIEPNAYVSAEDPLSCTVGNAKLYEALNAGFIDLERSLFDQEV